MFDIEKYRENGEIKVDKILIDTPQEQHFETLGARNKFWFNDFTYLFKEIYTGTYEDYAEIIAAELADYLGLEHAEYDFATFNGKKGVVTKNFLNDDAGEVLITGKEIINDVFENYIKPIQFICEEYKKITSNLNLEEMDVKEKKELITTLNHITQIYGLKNNQQEFIKSYLSGQYDEYDSKIADDILERYNEYFYDLEDIYGEFFTYNKEKEDGDKNSIESKVNNLFDLWGIIDIYIKMYGLGDEQTSIDINNALYDLFIFDVLTLQGDRHAENWSVIIEKDKKSIRLAPLFDNSNIFNLNRRTKITHIDQLTQQLNDKNLNPNKKRGTKNQLKKSLYHPKVQLLVDEESKRNYLEQVSKFVAIYSKDDLQELKNKLDKIDDDAFNYIFSNIKSKTSKEIPEDIKRIVIQSIKTNKEEIEKIIEEQKGGKSL